MLDVRSLSIDELRMLGTSISRELRLRQSPTLDCATCGVQFRGRSDARYCSSRCRVANHRSNAKQKERELTGIYSVGYEGLTIDALVSRLRLHGVSTVADVRLNAISRKKGFSKSALSKALNEAGIEYLHLRELGNQRDNREGYSDVDTSEGRAARARFISGMAESRAEVALEQLAELAANRKVAVFCYEADQTHCHREQVIEDVQRRITGVVVAR